MNKLKSLVCSGIHHISRQNKTLDIRMAHSANIPVHRFGSRENQVTTSTPPFQDNRFCGTDRNINSSQTEAKSGKQ